MSEFYGSFLCGLICTGLAFLVVIGVVVLLYVNHTRSKEKTAIHPNWRPATARVTATRVEETARTRVDEDDFYYPLIEFEYQVEGQVYTGKQAVGRPFNIEFKAKQTLRHYPPGIEVVVYYNPDKPSETRLKK
jgi:hypothetical protein